MKPRSEEELDEARLQALFDATSELPTGPTLTKLSARAADIPVHARRRRWWPSLRIALPASAALAGALAVLTLPQLQSAELPPPTAPLAQASQILPAPAGSPSAESGAEADDDFESSFAFADDGTSSAIGLEAEGVESDAELDAWLQATADLVDEGG